MSNRGRSTTGDAAVPYYVRTPRLEAAEHLRLMVTRYIADRASLEDVRRAMGMLTSAVTEETAVETEELSGAKLARSVDELSLTNRASHCLMIADIRTLGDLTQLSMRDILRLRGAGYMVLRDIEKKLSELGLALRCGS